MARRLDVSPPCTHPCYRTAGPCNELDRRGDPNEEAEPGEGNYAGPGSGPGFMNG